MKSIIIFAGSVLFWCLFAGSAMAGSGITYHGRLLKSDGTAVNGTNVEFRIQIRTPGNENCLMYQETHYKNLSTSDGIFAIGINDGTAAIANAEPFTLDRVFQNRGMFSFGGGKCSGGTTYSPNPTDGRKIVVEFNDGSFVGYEPLPTQAINFVPMSIESMTVGGFDAKSLLRVVDGSGDPVTTLPLTQAQHNTLLDLVAGTSGTYLTSSSPLAGGNLVNASVTDAKLATGISGSKIAGNISGNAAGFTGNLAGDVTGPQGATVVARLQGRNVDTAPPSDGQVLKWNNSASRWEPANDLNSGTVAAVTGTLPISVTAGANPVVSIADGSSSAKGAVMLALDGQSDGSKAVAANDSRLSDSRTPTTHTHGYDSLVSASGVYLTYKPNNVACTDGQVMKWSTADQRWNCGNDAAGGGGTLNALGVLVPAYMTSSHTTGSRLNADGDITIGFGTQTARQVFAAPTGSTGAPTFRHLGISDLQSTAGGAFFLPAGGCATGTQLSYQSPADTLSCVAFALTTSQVTTALGYTPADPANFVAKAGDTMTGALVLPANGLTLGTDQLVVSGAKVGVGTASPATKLDVVGTLKVGDGLELCNTGTHGGMIRYAGTSLQFCNGTAWQTLGVSGAGLTSLNGLLVSTQTFAVPGTSGTAPSWTSAGSAHTLNIPMASAAGVTAGLLSKTKYDEFDAKLTSVSGSSLANGQVWVGDSGGLAVARTLSNDATVSNTGVLTLKNTGTAGTYGSATQVPVLTTDAQGRVTGVTNTAIAITGANVSNTPAGNIAATTSQAAIDELDSEKVAKSGDTMTGALVLPSNGLAVGATEFVVAGGRVGIGTATPAYPLTINGMVSSLTGGFRLPDGTIIDEASDIGGSTTSALYSGWPDAIVCTQDADVSNPKQPRNFLFGGNYSNGNDQIYYQLVEDIAGSASSYLVFNSNKTWASHTNATNYSNCLNKSISTLVSQGHAKFFGNDVGSIAQDDDNDTKIMVEKNVDEDQIRFDTAGSERVIIDSTGKVGVGTGTPATLLHVMGTVKVADGAEACNALAHGGMIRYSGTSLQFCNGTAWQTVSTGSASVTSLNGLTVPTQTFATPGTSGTAPAWTSAGSAHTLNIPMASAAGVTAGLLNKTDYDAFAAKLGTATTFAGDVTGTSATTKVEKIQGTGVSSNTPATGQVLVLTGGVWTPTNFGIDDLRTNAGLSQFATGACSTSQTLTWSAITDAFTCSNIGITGSNITDGTIAAADLDTSLNNSLWTAASGNVYRSSGRVGVGTNAPGFPLHVQGTSTATAAGDVAANFNYMWANPASSSAARFIGQYNGVENGPTAAAITGELIGQGSYAEQSSTNTITKMTGAWAGATNKSSGLVTTAVGVQGMAILLGTGNVTTGIGLHGSVSDTGAGTIATGIGLMIGDIQATNKWSIFSTDAAASAYFAGNVGIGTSLPTYPLEVAGTLALNGATSGRVTLQAPATGGVGTLTLPAGNGSNGEVLTTNGAGQLSWSAAVGGSTNLPGTSVVMSPYVAGSIVTANHGLGQVPTFTLWYLECLTAEYGYSVGDRVYSLKDTGGGYGFSIFTDATKVGISTDAAPKIMHKTSANVDPVITASRWKLVGVPYKSLPIGQVDWLLNGSDLNFPGGKVGIGASAPTVELHIKNALVDSEPAVRLENDVQAWQIQTRGSDNDIFSIWDATGGASRLAIAKTTGYVGIGTTAPNSPLTVSNSSNTGGSVTASFIQPNLPAAGTTYLKFGVDGGNNNLADIRFDYAGNNSTSNSLNFGFAGSATIPLTIRANGNVGVGTNNPGHKLHVIGTAGLSSGTTWTNTSDIRLKDVRGSYQHGLNEILQLKTIRFNYKKDNPLGLPSDNEVIGFVAQEVQKVIPEAVHPRPDGYLELNVDPIHWAMVNALKQLYHKWFTDSAELHEQIDQLQTEVDQLKALVCADRPQAEVCQRESKRAPASK